MKIVDVVLTKSYTGFYFDDQKAIKQGAGHDGFMYVGKPVTEGFQSIRQAGEAISIQLILEDGTVGYGDCAAVQYSGAGGRDPLFLSSKRKSFLNLSVKTYPSSVLLPKNTTECSSTANAFIPQSVTVSHKRCLTLRQTAVVSPWQKLSVTNTTLKRDLTNRFPYSLNPVTIVTTTPTR